MATEQEVLALVEDFGPGGIRAVEYVSQYDDPTPPLPPIPSPRMEEVRQSSRQRFVKVPVFLAIAAFSSRYGNNTWNLTSHHPDGLWPDDGAAFAADLRTKALLQIKQYYELDEGELELHVIVLDGYHGTDYQPSWGKRAHIPAEHSTDCLWKHLPKASALFVWGYRGMGCNIRGLRSVLRDVSTACRLYFLVRESDLYEHWILPTSAVDLVSALTIGVGSERALYVRKRLIKATEDRYMLVAQAILARDNDTVITRQAVGEVTLSCLPPCKTYEVLPGCEDEDCPNSRHLCSIGNAAVHQLSQHADLLNPTTCPMCDRLHTTVDLMHVHMRTAHLMKKLVCTISLCFEAEKGKEFDPEALRRHLRDVHSGVEQDAGLIKYLEEADAQIAKAKMADSGSETESDF